MHDTAHYESIASELALQEKRSPRLREFYGEVMAAAGLASGERQRELETLLVGIGSAIESGAELTDDTEAALRERYSL